MDTPTQMSGPTTTVDSKAEGRLIVGAGKQTCAHGKVGKCLKCSIKSYKADGKGGPGNMLPTGSTSVTDVIAPPSPLTTALNAMSPARGITPTSSSFSPQQSMQMASSGMQPIGSGAVSAPLSKTAIPNFQRLSNKPHHSARLKTSIPKLPRMKALKINSLRATVRAATKKPKAVF